MSILDELKKLAHPYEDEDEEFEDFDDTSGKDVFEDRRVKPERFENASEIADQLKDKRTVVLNLESTNKDVARRLIDFLSGVAYAGEGKIKKVAANTYIITPYHVDIEGDLIDELENNGLYF